MEMSPPAAMAFTGFWDVEIKARVQVRCLPLCLGRLGSYAEPLHALGFKVQLGL